MAPTSGPCDCHITPASSQPPCEEGQGHEPHFPRGEPVKTEPPRNSAAEQGVDLAFPLWPWGCFVIKHPALPTAPLLHHGHVYCKQMPMSSRWCSLNPHSHYSDHKTRTGGGGGERTCGKTNLICNQVPVSNTYHVPSGIN